jgi:drug/metabolite transporter (DMT)-like permease
MTENAGLDSHLGPGPSTEAKARRRAALAKYPAPSTMASPAGARSMPKPSVPMSHPVVLAALWMGGTLVSFMVMAIGGRELSSTLGTAEILFFRSAIGLGLLLAFTAGRLRTATPAQLLRTQRLGLHAVRNIAHFAGQFGWFFGIAYIPLAEVFALEFTVPIWTAVLAPLLLHERLTRARIAAVALGFLGVLIMLRPGLEAIDPAAIAVLLGAASYGVSHTLTRKLARSETPLVVLFYMTLIQLPLGFALALDAWVVPPPAAWPWLTGIAAAGLSGHYCLTRALALADATLVVPMDFLRLPLIALVGYVLYAEQIDLFVGFGAAVMLLGNVLNVRAAARVHAAGIALTAAAEVGGGALRGPQNMP